MAKNHHKYIIIIIIVNNYIIINNDDDNNVAIFSPYHTTLLYCCCTKLWSEQLRQSNELAYQFVCKERETSQYVRPADRFPKHLNRLTSSPS